MLEWETVLFTVSTWIWKKDLGNGGWNEVLGPFWRWRKVHCTSHLLDPGSLTTPATGQGWSAAVPCLPVQYKFSSCCPKRNKTLCNKWWLKKFAFVRVYDACWVVTGSWQVHGRVSALFIPCIPSSPSLGLPPTCGRSASCFLEAVFCFHLSDGHRKDPKVWLRVWGGLLTGAVPAALLCDCAQCRRWWGEPCRQGPLMARQGVAGPRAFLPFLSQHHHKIKSAKE